MKPLFFVLLVAASLNSFASTGDIKTCAKSLVNSEFVSSYEKGLKTCKNLNQQQHSYAENLKAQGFVDNLGEGLALASIYSCEEMDLAILGVNIGDFENIQTALSVLIGN